MAQSEGFGSGLQVGLQMFNSMQNAAYMQSLQASQREAQAMRREELALQQSKFQFDQEQKELTIAEYALAHPEVGPQARVQAYNTINKKLAGPNARQINETDINAFDADLNNFPERLEATNDQVEQKKLMADLQARAAQSPLHQDAFNRQLPVFKQIMEQRGSYAAGKAMWGELFNEQELNKWVRKTPAEVVAKTFNDKDTQKMFIQRKVEENLRQFHSGEVRFSDAQLRDTMAMARTLGMELGPKAETLLKTHDTYTMYNQTTEALTQAQQTMDPLFKQIRNAPGAKELLEMSAESRPSGSYGFDKSTGSRKSMEGDLLATGPLGYYQSEVQAAEMEDQRHTAFLQKNPQIAQSLSELVPQAQDAVMKGDRRLADIASKRKLLEVDKLAPNRDMMFHLYDQEEESIKTQLAPYRALAKYGENPGIPALQQVLKLEKTLGKSLTNVSALRDTALNNSERIANNESKLKFETANETKATHDVQLQLNNWMAENPDADEATLRGKAAEFGKAAKIEYGVAPDSNKVLDNVISKRTQTQLISSDERKRLSEGETNIITGEDLLSKYKPEYVGPADNFFNSKLAKLPEGSPEFLKLTAEHQQFRQQTELFLTQYRNKMFGASLSPNEEKSALAAMANLGMGDDQFPAALKEMIKWDKVMNERIAANVGKGKGKGAPKAAPLQDQVSKAPVDSSKSFDAYHEWKKKNPNGTPAQFMGN